MSEIDKVFTGSIPENYDRYMVPLIFEGFAEDIAQRVARHVRQAPFWKPPPAAAWLLVHWRQDFRRTPATSSPTSTSRCSTMLLRDKVPTPRISWRKADAQALPFEDAAFDLVCCQFGVMFFPDRQSGYREARRVLKSGGCFLFNVWDRIEENVFANDVTNALAKSFRAILPAFWRARLTAITTPH